MAAGSARFRSALRTVEYSTDRWARLFGRAVPVGNGWPGWVALASALSRPWLPVRSIRYRMTRRRIRVYIRCAKLPVRGVRCGACYRVPTVQCADLHAELGFQCSRFFLESSKHLIDSKGESHRTGVLNGSCSTVSTRRYGL